jgi:formylglycine-generating enzyme required for sulfatase activity
MTRIFISYSRKDQDFARRLAESLAQMGADIWLDVDDIPAGMKWSSAIQEGLDTAQVLIVIISPDSMTSRNVEDEWHYYLDNNKPVLPVLLEPAKIHFQLSRIQYVDFHTQPFDVALFRLQHELARLGFPLGTVLAPAQQPPPPQTYAHPTGQIPPISQPKPTTVNRRSPLPFIMGFVLLVLVVGAIGVFLSQSPSQEGVATQQSETRTPPTTQTVLTGPVNRNSEWTSIERTINGIPMVLVPSGSFRMGATHEQIEYGYSLCEQINACPDLNDESTQRSVEFTQPFWIDQFEYGDRPGEGLPKNNVTWNEAQALCNERGGRLPTESEWEYAARGPDALMFPWGDEVEPDRMNVCDTNCPFDWRDASLNDGYEGLAPVGSFPQGRSWVGAMDMAGNLWEWTSTVYTYNSNEGYQSNEDLNARRVLKGSSWNWIAAEGRTTSRSPHANGNPKSDWYGFRCVREFRPEDLEGG